MTRSVQYQVCPSRRVVAVGARNQPELAVDGCAGACRDAADGRGRRSSTPASQAAARVRRTRDADQAPTTVIGSMKAPVENSHRRTAPTPAPVMRARSGTRCRCEIEPSDGAGSSEKLTTWVQTTSGGASTSIVVTTSWRTGIFVTVSVNPSSGMARDDDQERRRRRTAVHRDVSSDEAANHYDRTGRSAPPSLRRSPPRAREAEARTTARIV